MAAPFFYLKPTEADKNIKKILVCYSCRTNEGNDTTFKYSTGVRVKYVPPARKGLKGIGDWDATAKCIKSNVEGSEANNLVLRDAVKLVAEAIRRIELIEKKVVTPQLMREHIELMETQRANELLRKEKERQQEFIKAEKTDSNKAVLPFIEKILDEMKANEDYSPNTAKIYNTLAIYFSDYQILTGKQYTFSDIDIDFFKAFKNYLETKKKPLSGNSLIKYLRTFKTVLQTAVEQKRTTGEDFSYIKLWKHLKLKYISPTDIYLSEKEIEKIYSLHTVKDLQKKIDKLFAGRKEENIIKRADIMLREVDRTVLTAWVSVRHSDQDKLKGANMKPAANGNFQIRIKTQKTKAVIYVPVLHKFVKEIFERRPDFPTISNQKANRYIKQVCELAGINEKIKIPDPNKKGKEMEVEKWTQATCHTTRRSFITNMIKRNYPIPKLAKITGQSEKVIMATYNKLTSQDVANEIAESGFFITDSEEPAIKLRIA